MSISGTEPTDEEEAQRTVANYDNPEGRDELRDAVFEKKEEQEVKRREAHADEEAILNAIERETVTVRLKGKPMEFRRFLADTEDEIDGLVEKYQTGPLAEAEDDADLDDDMLEQFRSDKHRFAELLAEHNQDEGKYDVSFWSRVPTDVRMEVINRIRQGGEESERAGN